MVAIEGLGKIGEYISTTEKRPLEQPDQPQQSLGEIIFTSINPKQSYQAASNQTKLQHEKAALYSIQKWNDNITKPFSHAKEYGRGAHLYVGLYSDSSIEEEERKGYQEWEKEGRDLKSFHSKTAARAMNTVLVRAMTLQQGQIDGQPLPQSFYPVFSTDPNPRKQSLGEIAHTSRFAKDNFRKTSPTNQSKWEDAAQYLLYAWHQRIAGVISHFRQFSWGTHLYIGIFSSINDGYEIWPGEPVEMRESYDIAATEIMKALLRHTTTLQQQRIDGQPSPESLYPA